MARPKTLKNCKIVSIRMEDDMLRLVEDLAHLEKTVTGRHTTGHQLIRMACDYVFKDNDRMREMFRRNRAQSAKRYH